MILFPRRNFQKRKDGSLFLAALLLVVLTCDPAMAQGFGKICSKTAKAAYKACVNEIADDYWIAEGNCINLADLAARDECLDIADEEVQEGKEGCSDQKEARLEICEDLGEYAYDPLVEPGDFVDFEDVVNGGNFTDNPWFPLTPGTIWEYNATDEGGEVVENILVEVTNATIEIMGVNCIVVRDRVWEIDDGEKVLVEDTFDWHGQKLNGEVWYFGEISKEYEDGELISLEGSWKAGVDYAKPGIIMPAMPAVGDYYRQEFALGDAEDMGEVVSTTGSAVLPFITCNGDCVVTRDWTPIEPDVEELKYYKEGTGLILEEDLESGEMVMLIHMTTP